MMLKSMVSDDFDWFPVFLTNTASLEKASNNVLHDQELLSLCKLV